MKRENWTSINAISFPIEDKNNNNPKNKEKEEAIPRGTTYGCDARRIPFHDTNNENSSAIEYFDWIYSIKL